MREWDSMRHAGGMHLPGPLRAAVGLAATAAAEAKHLPDRAIELPMLVVSSALQASLRAQQRYARLAARGDEVLNRRAPTEEPPAWATFDEPVPLDNLLRPPGATGRGSFEQLFGSEDPTIEPDGHEPVDEILPPDEPPVVAVPKPAKKAAGKKVTAKKASRKTATRKPAKRAATVKTVSKPRHTEPSPFDNVSDDTVNTDNSDTISSDTVSGD